MYHHCIYLCYSLFRFSQTFFKVIIRKTAVVIYVWLHQLVWVNVISYTKSLATLLTTKLHLCYLQPANWPHRTGTFATLNWNQLLHSTGTSAAFNLHLCYNNWWIRPGHLTLWSTSQLNFETPIRFGTTQHKIVTSTQRSLAQAPHPHSYHIGLALNHKGIKFYLPFFCALAIQDSRSLQTKNLDHQLTYISTKLLQIGFAPNDTG